MSILIRSEPHDPATLNHLRVRHILLLKRCSEPKTRPGRTRLVRHSSPRPKLWAAMSTMARLIGIEAVAAGEGTLQTFSTLLES